MESVMGKGRCNLTNASDIEEIFEHIVTNRKFLYSALYGFDNRACMDFFEENGLHLKVPPPSYLRRRRRSQLLYSYSSFVRGLFNIEKRLKALSVEIRLHTRVESLITESDYDTCAA